MVKHKRYIKYICFLFCALCVFFYMPGISFCEISEKEVVSLGVGDLNAVSEASSRDSAIEDALRRAVEQAVGTLVNSESMVENFELLYDRIYSKSTGHIKSYDIIDSYKEGNLYKVKVKAIVSLDDIIDELDSIGILISRKHKPRVMVIIKEEITDKTLQVYPSLTVTENVIINKLIGKGFKIVDAKESKELTKHNRLLHSLGDDNRLAAKIGNQYGAEVMIIGKAIASWSNIKISPNMKSVNVNATVRAIRSDNAEVIASADESATKVHIDVAKGAQNAFKEIGNRLSDGLIKQILDKWRIETTNLALVELTISGLNSFKELLKLKNAIKQDVRGVGDIHQRIFTGGVARFEVDIRGDTQSLAEELAGKKLGDMELDITDVTQNKIIARIK